jgi:hypothetical protein
MCFGDIKKSSSLGSTGRHWGPPPLREALCKARKVEHHFRLGDVPSTPPQCARQDPSPIKPSTAFQRYCNCPPAFIRAARIVLLQVVPAITSASAVV